MPTARFFRYARALPPASALLPRRVADRLYASAALTAMTISMMALVTVVYAHRLSLAADHFYIHTVSASFDAAELALLLEKHRRIVETAPVDLDRADSARDRRQADAVSREIAKRAQVCDDPELREIVANLMPKLLETTERVLHLAENFAQDQALKAVRAYSEVADVLQGLIRAYRARQLEAVDAAVNRLREGGGRLIHWVIGGTFLALVIMGPMSIAILRDVATRLRAVTDAMLALARNDTSNVIPSLGDKDEVGEIARAVAVFKRNAIALIDQTGRLAQLNQWFDIALNNMARGLSMFDKDQRLLVANRKYGEIYGIPDELLQPGTPLQAIIAYYCGADGKTPAAVDLARTHARALTAGRLVAVSVQALSDGGWVDVHEDITEKRAAEERMHRLAREDALTAIANRYGFREALDRALAGGPGPGLAVHIIDLDRFKEVNDSLGHPAGDALLQGVATRLKACVRASDIVARLGGDEFAILQPGAATDKEANGLARRALEAFRKPFDIAGQAVMAGASMGTALCPRDGTNATEILRNADVALYEAKARGRGGHVLFMPEHARAIDERRQVESELRLALARCELELHYQPIVDLACGRVCGVEALMRWRHPERGLVPPIAFIPVAEETGLIVEMGIWALRQAAADAVSWPDGIKVAVNLSAAEFAGADLVGVIGGILHETGLAANRLEVEVTETLLLKEDASTLATLHGLRAMGVRVALDDFGTGFASLSYLRSFPFDKLKIDRSFVLELPKRADCAAIVRAVSGLARTLNIGSVAEGIETFEHLALVANAGCNEAQGYLLGRPSPNAQLPDAIANAEATMARFREGVRMAAA